MKKYYIILICIACIMFSGCWNRRELNTIGIVSGIAIDKDNDTNEYIITVQVIRPSVLNNSKNSSKAPVELVTSRGSTISDAIRNTTLFLIKNCF